MSTSVDRISVAYALGLSWVITLVVIFVLSEMKLVRRGRGLEDLGHYVVWKTYLYMCRRGGGWLHWGP